MRQPRGPCWDMSTEGGDTAAWFALRELRSTCVLGVSGWEPGSRPTRSINTPIVLCHHTKMTRELKLSCCQRLPLRLSFNGPFRRIVGVAYSAGDNVLENGGDTVVPVPVRHVPFHAPGYIVIQMLRQYGVLLAVRVASKQVRQSSDRSLTMVRVGVRLVPLLSSR